MCWTRGGAVYLSVRPPGADFGAPIRMSFPPTAYEPRLAANRRGEWLLTWNQGREGPHYGVAIARRAPGAETWALPSSASDVLSPDRFFSNAPVPALDDEGRAVISWYQSLGGPLRALASERANENAAFSRGDSAAILSAPAGPVDSDPWANVKPSLDGKGGAAVAWTQEDARGVPTLRVALRDRAPGWRLAPEVEEWMRDAPACRAAQLSFGPAGDLFLAWAQDDAGVSAVHAARRSSDGRWDARPLRLSTPGALAFDPRMTVGGDGAALVAWTERGADGHFRILARASVPPQLSWDEARVLSPDSAGDATQPAVAAGCAGRVVVAWAQGPAASQRVYAATRGRCR